MNGARRFLGNQAGATMLEYGLMISLIAVVVVGLVRILGGSVDSLFTRVLDAFGL